MNPGSNKSKLSATSAKALAEDIDMDLIWLENLILYQLGEAEEGLKNLMEKKGGIFPPNLGIETYYGKFIDDNKLNSVERGLVIMALAVYLKPYLYDPILRSAKEQQFTDTRLGGVIGNAQTPFLPTGETAIFLLTNGTLAERMIVMDVLSPHHWLFESGVLEFKYPETNVPQSFAAFSLTQDYSQLLTRGIADKPDYSMNFPATLVTTPLEWEDLVISDELKNEIQDIDYWISLEAQLMGDDRFKKKIKRGYKVVFYGSSGTGKTLVAGLLGKRHGIDVYRIDLSQLSSKYIGETEKNLENLFQQAKNKNWILFFDEGESLFGKRTNSGSGNERYGNQQVGFLLQKIEDHPGVVILATNLKGNIDEAFIRRFQKMIYFDEPDREFRMELWEKALENTLELDPKIDIKEISKEYKLVGGQIVNVVKQVILREMGVGSDLIHYKTLISCIEEELKK